MGGEHQPHEEAGLGRDTEENDHHQVKVKQLLTRAPFEFVSPGGLSLLMFAFRGTVHQSFPDFTFLSGNWIGKLMKLKGEIDPEIGIDLSNKATLAFLQRHLGEIKSSFSSPITFIVDYEKSH